jgi:hypothetical protein
MSVSHVERRDSDTRAVGHQFAITYEDVKLLKAP